MKLFVAQRFDGIQSRGFYGGIHAEEQSDAHRYTYAEHNGPERYGGGQRGINRARGGADEPSESDADESSEASEDHRFGKKLPDDVASPRADGFADADFARALRDRHKHDVHDAHAAD